MNYTVDAFHFHSFEHAKASALEFFFFLVLRLLNHILSASYKVTTVLHYEFLNMTPCTLAVRYHLLAGIQYLHILVENLF